MEREGLADYLRSFEHRAGIVVCQDAKFIYMKPPRTAGTSMFRAVLDKRFNCIHHKDKPRAFSGWLSRVEDSDLKDYFIFSFTRNPWDRAVSAATYFSTPFPAFVTMLTEDKFTNRNMRLHCLPTSIYSHANGKMFADFVGRFEQLRRDFSHILSKLGQNPNTRLPHISKTRRGTYTKYYNAETENVVGSYYSSDCEAFGYTFK